MTCAFCSDDVSTLLTVPVRTKESGSRGPWFNRIECLPSIGLNWVSVICLLNCVHFGWIGCSAPFHGASKAEIATHIYWVGMNPNHLTKDELLYELGIRGIDTVVDTLSLRRLFRKFLTRDLPLQFSYLTSGATEGLYLGISTKVLELQKLVGKSEINWISLAPTVLSKVRHLRGQLQHLTKAGLCSTNSENLCVQELQAQLNHIEQLVYSMSKGGDTTRQLPSIQMGGDEDRHKCSWFEFANGRFA